MEKTNRNFTLFPTPDDSQGKDAVQRCFDTLPASMQELIRQQGLHFSSPDALQRFVDQTTR